MSQQQHLSADLVADLLEGSLPAADAMAANAHLVECLDCAALRDALLDVSAVLAEEGAAGWQMPADVAASLDTALTTASRERAAGVVRLDPERRAVVRGPLRWLAGAAAAVAVAGIGVAGWQAIGSGGPGADSAGSAAPGAQKSFLDSGGGAGNEGYGTGRPPIFSGNGKDIIAQVAASAVPQQAVRLAQHPAGRVSPTRYHCATPISGGPSTVVMWHDHLAVLVVNSATRTATILDCATAVHVLYHTGY